MLITVGERKYKLYLTFLYTIILQKINTYNGGGGIYETKFRDSKFLILTVKLIRFNLKSPLSVQSVPFFVRRLETVLQYYLPGMTPKVVFVDICIVILLLSQIPIYISWNPNFFFFFYYINSLQVRIEPWGSI